MFRENKEQIVASIFDAFKTMRFGQDIESMSYEFDNDTCKEYVIVKYTYGDTERVNVTMDSGIAMLYDILKRLY